MKIQNPHDKYFKETFGKVAVARDFLHNYLPQGVLDIIDVNTLEPQKDSFINEELQENFSDLLFKAAINEQAGYLFFLFEHKSYPSRDIALQLLRYIVEIWNTKISKEENHELSVIIPMVIYHGDKSWSIKNNLGAMISGYEELPSDIRRHIPDYQYLLYDLSRYTDEQMKGETLLRIPLIILRDIFSEDGPGLINSVIRAAEYLLELEDKQSRIEYFEALIRYVFSAGKNLTKTDIIEIVKKLEKTYPEGSEKMMTIAEILREEGMEKGIVEGLKEGIKEGIKEGETKALARTAMKLLAKKFGPLAEELKIKISKLDAPTLDAIIDGILDYESLEDVERHF